MTFRASLDGFSGVRDSAGPVLVQSETVGRLFLAAAEADYEDFVLILTEYGTERLLGLDLEHYPLHWPEIR